MISQFCKLLALSFHEKTKQKSKNLYGKGQETNTTPSPSQPFWPNNNSHHETLVHNNRSKKMSVPGWGRQGRKERALVELRTWVLQPHKLHFKILGIWWNIESWLMEEELIPSLVSRGQTGVKRVKQEDRKSTWTDPSAPQLHTVCPSEGLLGAESLKPGTEHLKTVAMVEGKKKNGTWRKWVNSFNLGCLRGEC